jgi:hypothetical protein
VDPYLIVVDGENIGLGCDVRRMCQDACAFLMPKND